MSRAAQAPARGRLAEDAACRWLAEHGFTIIRRNARLAGGELDIIAQEGDILAFVEVKAFARRSHGMSLEAVDSRKISRLCAAAAAYVARHDIQLRCRFDVLTVDLAAEAPACQLYRDAFRPE